MSLHHALSPMIKKRIALATMHEDRENFRGIRSNAPPSRGSGVGSGIEKARAPFNVTRDSPWISMESGDPGKLVPQSVAALRSLVRGLTEQLRHERCKLKVMSSRLRQASESEVTNALPDVIDVNVGGTIFTTKLSTLTRIPGSYLAAMFNGHFSIDVDETCSVFIDRSPKYFGVILDWLRDSGTHGREWPIEDPAFLHEVEYFGLHDAMFGRGQIYIVGGQTDIDGKLTNAVMRYNPVKDAWTTSLAVPGGERSFHAAIAIQHGERMVVLGGRGSNMKMCKSTFCFDPQKSQWEAIETPRLARSSLGMVAHEDCVYAIGGMGDDGPSDSVECYNVVTQKWGGKAKLPFPRARMACCVVDHHIYVVGGCSSLLEPPSASVLQYDIRNDVWREVCPMSSPRRYVACVAVDGRVYAIGGTATSADRAMEVYDPTTDAWAGCAEPMRRRHAPACAVLQGRIYILGGTAQDEVLSSVEVYCPASDTWSSAASMPLAIFAAAACTLLA